MTTRLEDRARAPQTARAAGAPLLAACLLLLAAGPVPGTARGVPSSTTPASTTTTSTAISPMHGAARHVLAGKRDRENDIDFDGLVSSSEQQATSLEQALNQARGVAVDAEETVAEVQRILEMHPQLPRLSRGDILAILDNITRSSLPSELWTTPLASATSTAASTELTDWPSGTEPTTATPVERTTASAAGKTTASRAENARELMVVLPFSANNLSESNIKELYTKAPLTHIIGDELDAEHPVRPTRQPPRRRHPATTTATPAPTPASSVEYRVTEDLGSDSPPPPQEAFVGQPSKKRPPFSEQRWRAPATSAPTAEEDDADYTTKKRRQGSTSRPWRGQRRTTAVPEADSATTPRATISTSAATPTDYPAEPTVVPSNHKPYYTEPTIKPWRTSTVPSPVFSTKKPVKNKSELELGNKKAGARPVSSGTAWTPVPPSKSVGRPAPPRGTVLPSLHDLKKTTAKPVMRDDVKELLASIGLRTGAVAVPAFTRSTLAATISTTTTTTEPSVPNAAHAADSLTPEMKDILVSIGLLPGKGEPLAAPSPPGSAPTPYQPTITTQPVVPDVDPSSYVQFKPLPLAQDGPAADMHDFLASFGLVPSIQSARIVSTPDEYLNMDDLPSRGGKALSASPDAETSSALVATATTAADSAPETDPDNTSYAELGGEEVLPEAVYLKADVPTVESDSLPLPDDMKAVLDNLGLTTSATRQGKRIDSHKNKHVFNPVAHSAKLDDRREAEKVIKLLSSIRVLPIGPNGTTVIPERLVADLAASTVTAAVFSTTPSYGFRKKQPSGKRNEQRLEEDRGPNPLSSQELRLFLETAKNEVKRQQEASNSSASSSSSTSSSSSESATSSSSAGYDENAANLATTVIDDFTGTVDDANTDTTPALSSTSSTSTTTTTTEAPVANLDDLADSFGGDGDRPKNTGPVDTLPPARPNGLYFLFDWNTFLNVGEEGKNPVKLNFAPRIGDPKRFIEVKVP